MLSQKPDNSNNLIIAIVLSMAVLLVWQFFFPPPKPPQQPAVEHSETQKPTKTGEVPAAPVAPAAGSSGVAQVPGGGAGTAPAAGRVPLATPSLKGSIGLLGGRIDDVTFVKYHETVDPSSPNVVLFAPADTSRAYFAEYGWIPAAAGSTFKLPQRDTVWTAPEGAKLTHETPVTLTWDNGEGLVFKRTISVDDEYMFKIVDEVQNNTSGDITLHPYARIYRYGTPKIEGFFIQHEGLIGWVGEAGLNEITYSGALEEGGAKKFTDKTGGWLGFTDKYWAATLVPDQSVPYTANMRAVNQRTDTQREAFQADYMRSAITVAAGGSANVSGHLFAGAKRVQTIDRYEADLGILEFNYLVDWGWFYFITKPLYYLLDWLYKHLGNFGLAILAVTVIVKAAFYPLASKAYESMGKMKKLQPEMEKMRQRFPDDKARQQKELMALYQKEKINPLAGCLPILLQIPVFFALYKVLFVSIDMRHAPFFGWIQDLSAPDPTSVFNLFGLLPFMVPEFLHVGAWPLIMGVTMWLQMQLNPAQPDPTQQMIFNWMPVMFTFLLATFPAGLVIYWAWNNVLSLAQQYLIMKRQGVEVPLMGNIKKTLLSVRSLVPGGRKSE
ncbi:Membrane protein insertase YidC [Candidatus Filomicrobium marinum]|uniref:Membrane protein insertase YidC n=2 Tax=Filomicrobium TaxID=119044 RepID=A0A0D6JCD0_9HYPH|nr:MULTISPECIES: membrane protein insertase YidC [Filomicrobium]MCV0370520.1 membrane protein insertase YidC [Filomicrobium sp.]CFX08382.1 Membrane protein insertase YidC [Candidatus Filomicrobium marinum]CPR16780.1 Membrane protein insertase YidC [Candidatus Filomicrobium marinum]SDP59880.1 protein translocase subunit yidC [Filomicrobium insigne]